MKTTKEDFNVFVKECERLVKKLGLQSYNITYIHTKLNNRRAEVYIDYANGLAVVKLGFDWDDKARSLLSTYELKLAAKHEIGHLLVGRLHCIAMSRYISENEITEAVEEIANRLEGVL